MLADACAAIQSFLQAFSLPRTLLSFRQEADALLKRKERVPPRVDLLGILNKVLSARDKEQDRRGPPPVEGKKRSRPFNQEEVESIMEGLMQKMVKSPRFLNDEKMAHRVKRLSGLKVFQRLVDAATGNEQSRQSFGQESQPSQSSRGEQVRERPKLQKSPSVYGLKADEGREGRESSLRVDEKAPSLIESVRLEESEILSNPELVREGLQEVLQEDEYTGDDDPGYEVYEIGEREFKDVTRKIAEKYGYPESATAVGTKEAPGKVEEGGRLPSDVKFPQHGDEFYPIEYEEVVYDCFQLKIIYNREKTGFEDTKEFPILINSVIGGRYQQVQFLGSAAFSKAIEVLDLETDRRYCMKIIENNKDYFDQSIDEIKLLKYVNSNGDVDEKRVLRIFDYFYYKEHLFIVTELLKDNLYEVYKLCRQLGEPNYFTLPRIQAVCRQVLTALEYIHSLHLIHTDLKPENILLEDRDRAAVKVIDFGSSIFTHDRLSPYIQTRSYRAPQVILGLRYDSKIDIWSLGCIVAELLTGNVLFHNESIQGYLARVASIVGPWPEWMLREGKLVSSFMTKERLIFHELFDEGPEPSQGIPFDNSDLVDGRRKTGLVQIFVPKKTTLQARLRTQDSYFLDFVRWMLQIDPTKRPTASQALQHPFLTEVKYE